MSTRRLTCTPHRMLTASRSRLPYRKRHLPVLRLGGGMLVLGGRMRVTGGGVHNRRGVVGMRNSELFFQLNFSIASSR